jgi:hypothetical protein
MLDSPKKAENLFELMNFRLLLDLGLAMKPILEWK